MAKAFVLLSGGIDSTTCLYMAFRDFSDVEAVSIDYGQRHAKEIDHAKKSCDRLGIPHVVLPVNIPKTMLTDATVEIPKVAYSDIIGISPAYVPFRNGYMLSALASHAAGQYMRALHTSDDEGRLDEWALFFGAHAEDAQSWAYPDCTPEFVGAMANAIWVGTNQAVRLHTPLQWMRKHDIIKAGQALHVDWSDTWSCYDGKDMHCGVCPTCRARRAGFEAAGVPDPTLYETADI